MVETHAAQAIIEPSRDGPEIERLARLSPLEYDRVRKQAAKTLGVRPATLDLEVAALRKREVATTGSDGLCQDPEPWPKPVDGADLLDALAGTFERHVVAPIGAVDTFALWALFTHVHDAAYISPILALTSPTAECGKTTVLTLLGALVPRPLTASNITTAALFRAVEKWAPTLLVDEADTFLRDSDELRGVINSGHNRGAAFVIRTVGEDHEPKQFKTWAPKAIAMIGKLKATIASRSIHIELRRKAPADSVEPVRPDRLGHLNPLLRQATRWTEDHLEALRRAEPITPAALVGRAADNWRTLFAIADAAGGDWPDRARRAAEALTATTTAGQTAGIMLLADIRDIIEDRDRITSSELAPSLGGMEDRPWPEWKASKPITVRQIASLLEPFGIKPGVIRTATGTPRGYLADQFADAFRRYLPSQSATPQQSRNSGGYSAGRSATQAPNVADESGPKPAEDWECCGVADEKGARGENTPDSLHGDEVWEH